MIKKLDVTKFSEMYTIMEESFPPDERRPYEEQKALFENEYYNVYADIDNETVKGFVAMWNFREFLFIEHFAVNPDYRNQGTGAKILGEVTALYNKPACLEVEPPKDKLSKRRIGFYERNGFFLNEYPYTQPPISKGKNSVPLMIMSYGKSLSEAEFHIIKETLYREVYKVKM